eukprot:m.13744 g.13744  ORF g.13744 m.13744 type:complete len:147 (+) comp4915_c0_seq1:285-725(+)
MGDSGKDNDDSLLDTQAVITNTAKNTESVDKHTNNLDKNNTDENANDGYEDGGSSTSSPEGQKLGTLESLAPINSPRLWICLNTICLLWSFLMILAIAGSTRLYRMQRTHLYLIWSFGIIGTMKSITLCKSYISQVPRLFGVLKLD